MIVIRLIDLQIVNGQEYKEQSESKMLRETTIEAPRGEIYDRNGIVLATNKLSYDVVIYKTEKKEDELNSIILKLANILASNNDELYSDFPMESIKEGFYTVEDKQNVCKEYDIEETLNDSEVLTKLYEYFKIDTKYKNEEKFKILKIRYELDNNVFSLFTGVTIAKDVSYESMAIIEESGKELEGIQIDVNSKRYYPCGTLAAHLLGYVSSISSEEYSALKNDGYTYNSNIGKMGIETTFESYLKGENGIKRTEIDAEGEVATEYIYKEALSGNNVTLTIDYRLQKVAEDNLKKVVNNIRTGAKGYEKQE